MGNESIGRVTFHLDPDNPSTLTVEEQQAWDALKDLRDEDIDYSDIPPIRDFSGFRRASTPVRDLVPEENKRQITLRLDAEVLAFFKSTG